MRKALIVGDTGQDGILLGEFLRDSNIEAFGFSSSAVSSNLYKKFELSYIDSGNFDQIKKVVGDLEPNYVFYLAARHQSSSESTNDEHQLFIESFAVNTIPVVHFLQSIVDLKYTSRFFYAASSHVFGDPKEEPQAETTAKNPSSIYGITKNAGVSICEYYRSKYKVHASVGILYNHESPLRSSKFVTKKIVEQAVAIKQGRSDNLILGNLNAKIDWGYAGDYVRAMFAIADAPAPDTYVIGSGISHSVKDFVKSTFNCLGLDWNKYVTEDPSLIKKNLGYNLRADNNKLRSTLGWRPTFTFDEMVRHLVECEMKKVSYE